MKIAFLRLFVFIKRSRDLIFKARPTDLASEPFLLLLLSVSGTVVSFVQFPAVGFFASGAVRNLWFGLPAFSCVTGTAIPRDLPFEIVLVAALTVN
jgi:hypothetical protein